MRHGGECHILEPIGIQAHTTGSSHESVAGNSKFNIPKIENPEEAASEADAIIAYQESKGMQIKASMPG